MSSQDKITDTDQSRFWRGEFGDGYTIRNAATHAELARRLQLWSEILDASLDPKPTSILEVGANIGLNLRALRHLSDAQMTALEPNANARQRLIEDGVVSEDNVIDGLATKIDLPDNQVDFAFTSGVLIHVPPSDLLASCMEIYRVSSRYICCIEYFSQNPEEISYRDHSDVLFKRDFGGFWLDNFPDLRLLRYGFAWKRVTGLDDLTWWLMEKTT